MTSDQLVPLALARMPFLKVRERILLAELFPDPESFKRMTLGNLQKTVLRKLHIQDFCAGGYLREAALDQKYLTKRNIQCTFYNDSEYPALLKEIYDPPLVLFHQGHLPEADRPKVAVVGTRRPTSGGLKAAYRLGRELARAGVWVISGLAIGIDRAVQQGTVAGGGSTAAVVGNGIGTVYPRSSRNLAVALLKAGGSVISEYPPGVPPHKYHFPARNRIISGLADAVVVVEAPEKSGALITADYALEQG
ncbi:MAG TPA: DNA-protecting protein DprA, partial [Spirochaetia bacterium]|nr:DNA-protecting protein DprA [Spirochaetia bacterium]